MTPSTVISTGAPAAAAPPPAAADPPADTVALQKQIDELKGSNADLTRASEFWQSRAKEQPAAPREKAAPVVEPEDDTDVLDLLTTKGTKGLDELLKKRGFMSRDEVDATVNARANQLTKESELMGQYPDLKNKNTDFFKSTAMHYGDLVKQGVSQTVAMELAAERTELEFMRSGKIKSAPQKELDSKAEKEANRLARIAAQGGPAGTRQVADEEEDGPLNDEQKRIVRAMGITEEAYAARAKKGVSMKGLK